MELLAPVGDLQSFYSAIYHGADAVYLGLQSFNARIKAENFTTDNLAQIVEFAHLYGVKVYVTINVLVQDNEIDDFIATVKTCIQAKVDAYIIQDFGMAKLLLNHFPRIVLHASTQMGIHNLSGAKFLETLGFKRVVLSRETKLTDIKLIHEQTNLEIEYFVQGALCVAFSGNCYLSSLKNGNSGNRGKCLQLCRLPYQVYEGTQKIAEGYYLSAKDLCLMKQLQVLADAGVDSLKIEGRLKRASYVAQVTHSYRQAIDNFQTVNIEKEKSKISALFSRGQFNERAYLEHNFEIINPVIGNHQGRKIGRVLATVKFKQIYKITLRLSENIGQGDALRFVQDQRHFSVGVGNVNVLDNGTVEIFSKQKIPVGCDVYLLKSEAKEKVLTDYEKKLMVDFNLVAHENQTPELMAHCGKVSVLVRGEKVVELAKTASVTYEQVYKQLNKLSDTKFRLGTLNCDLGSVFIPVSDLNALRRKVISALEDAIIKQYNARLPQITEVNQFETPVLDMPKKNFYLVDSSLNLQVADLKNFNVILCPAEYQIDTVKDLVNALLAKGIKKQAIYLNLPIVSTEKEIAVLDEILQQIDVGIIANNYAHLRWIKQYRTVAGWGLNVFNCYTAMALLQLGCENIIWSLEKNDATNCGSVLVSGYPALMTLCHCPVREVFGNDCTHCRYSTKLTYQDEKHNRYHLRRIKIQHCYFELYSAEKYQKVTNCGKIYDLRGENGKI